MRKVALVVGTLGLSAVMAAAPARADLLKCHQGIEKNGTKLQASILKALTKCKDGFRKATSPALVATAATGCQAGLAKVIDATNPVSAMAKTRAALHKMSPVAVPPGACADQNLTDLGHLSTALFGDRWEALILLSALKGAYETQQLLIADFPNIMQTFGDNGCSLCAALSTPPCVNTVCSLTAASGAETKINAIPVPVPLAGATIIAGCEWPGTLTNEIGLIGTASVSFKPSLVLPTIYACNVSFRSLGVLSCMGSSAPRVDYTTCQDSLIGAGDPSGANDECETPGAICQPDPATAPTPTGGACATFTTSPSVEGDTFVLSSTRLRISTAAGGDGVRCTADDTYSDDTPPSIIPVTTGTATASVDDYNNIDGNVVSEGPVTGAVGPNCANARGGNNTGRTLVGAFPAADVANPASPLLDTVTKLTLICN
ncbi:MAG TPA: hypothetical protein VMS22_25850 [Candidatus Eisenbacteria bacterium]|nr:hypothetical protein [Candidatus Eisenbacteria bacterium]